MSRKSILLIGTGLLTVAAGAAVLDQQLGERRQSAAVERFETEFGPLEPPASGPAGEGSQAQDSAAHWLELGADALSTLSEADRVALNELWERKGDPGPGVEALLQERASALEHLRRAGTFRASSRGICEDAGAEAPPPDLLPHLWSKKILAADARSALAAGDRERLLADARALVTLRRALSNEPLLICQMISMSVELAYHELIQQTLLSELVDAELLEELAHELEVDTAGRGMRAALRLEAARTLRSARLDAESGWPWQRGSHAREVATAIDLYFHLAKATEMPATEIESYLESSSEVTPDVRVIAQTWIPNLIDGVVRSRASASVRQLAGLAIVARQYALEYGAYPDTLGGVAAADLSDPYGGGALVYQRPREGSASLSYPEGEELWQLKNPHAPHYQPRFSWGLPILDTNAGS